MPFNSPLNGLSDFATNRNVPLEILCFYSNLILLVLENSQYTTHRPYFQTNHTPLSKTDVEALSMLSLLDSLIARGLNYSKKWN